jgi:hypothetical protein
MIFPSEKVSSDNGDVRCRAIEHHRVYLSGFVQFRMAYTNNLTGVKGLQDLDQFSYSHFVHLFVYNEHSISNQLERSSLFSFPHKLVGY